VCQPQAVVVKKGGNRKEACALRCAVQLAVQLAGLPAAGWHADGLQVGHCTLSQSDIPLIDMPATTHCRKVVSPKLTSSHSTVLVASWYPAQSSGRPMIATSAVSNAVQVPWKAMPTKAGSTRSGWHQKYVQPVRVASVSVLKSAWSSATACWPAC